MKSPDLTRRATIACIAVLVAGSALGFLDGRLGLGSRMQPDLHIIAMSAAQALLLLCAARYLNRSARRSGGRDKFTVNRRFRLSWLPVTVFAALSATLAGILINAAMSAVPWINGPSGDSAGIYSGISPPALAVAVVVLPALSEEYFFRKAVLSAYRNRSYGAAVAASALLFSLLHASALNFAAPLFAGVLYALLTLLLQSVYPAMLAHIINNAMSLLIYAYEDRIRALGLGGYLLFLVLVLFFLCSYAALRLAETHLAKMNLPEKDNRLSARIQKSAFSPLLSLPFLALVLLWIARTVLKTLGYI